LAIFLSQDKARNAFLTRGFLPSDAAKINIILQTPIKWGAFSFRGGRGRVVETPITLQQQKVANAESSCGAEGHQRRVRADTERGCTIAV